ncbi:polyamine aminopropyltransferase [Methylorubrum suomiense]|uniref:Polyamine aminopropyltransferase n=1 Tax=Methylorubrum suomiense TaxID=144191 RepID=A0ABQ4UU06_9HYPH|nr:spermidine synthase [Methylorubrum suomiense]GJE74873.1 Polyamine aminopropyltransferase [Methylorubrum suomiense]
MIPWEHLDTAPIPGEAGSLRLMRRGAEFSIQLDRNELMNSRLFGSEEALARLAAERIATIAAPRVLIGGYGMGFTLRAALGHLPLKAAVTVAEIVPAVLAWARGPMAELTGPCLDNPRVAIREADVAAVIAERGNAYDAILLDVDNGPDGLTRVANDRLYDAGGLAAARAALRPGGLLAVWSAHPDTAFSRRLGQAGFAVEEVAIRARGKRGARHVIWLAGRR